MVVLVTISIQICIYLELLIIYVDILFRIFEQTVDFCELFCEGHSDLRIFMLMTVRELKFKGLTVASQVQHGRC